LRAQVRDNIQVVGFYDWGYVGAESFPDGSGDSHAGAGFGVRYITPIGPLRVDIGTPVGDPPSNDTLLLYIGIGQAF
jgi:translocation and assembly module TamA